ncbi:hypothetical protein [Ornithinimicrobium kibberense]
MPPRTRWSGRPTPTWPRRWRDASSTGTRREHPTPSVRSSGTRRGTEGGV